VLADDRIRAARLRVRRRRSEAESDGESRCQHDRTLHHVLSGDHGPHDGRILFREINRLTHSDELHASEGSRSKKNATDSDSTMQAQIGAIGFLLSAKTYRARTFVSLAVGSDASAPRA